MRITVLASGSRGNATLVEAGRTRLLVDAGVALRTLRRRLAELGKDGLTHLHGIIVTHAHGDHSAHAERCAAAFGARLYVPDAGTPRAAALQQQPGATTYERSQALQVGAIRVHPFPVPHDEPQVALVMEAKDGERAAVVTDLGTVPDGLKAHLAGVRTVLLECNHDPDLLANGPYPPMVRRRIASEHGHLSNEQAAALLATLGPELRTVVLMHLSEENNRPELARVAAERALGSRPVRVVVARQRRPISAESSWTQMALPLAQPA